jgi:uncharacterized DUF497 family protein
MPADLSSRPGPRRAAAALFMGAPIVAFAQSASPFMTGATALQTNILERWGCAAGAMRQRRSSQKDLSVLVYVDTITMRLTWDPAKRAKTLAERGLDFADAAIVFSGSTVEFEDSRADYGETRIICAGYLEERLVVVGYVLRAATRHIFSMRKANDREQRILAPHLEV